MGGAFGQRLACGRVLTLAGQRATRGPDRSRRSRPARGAADGRDPKTLADRDASRACPSPCGGAPGAPRAPASRQRRRSSRGSLVAGAGAAARSVRASASGYPIGASDPDRARRASPADRRRPAAGRRGARRAAAPLRLPSPRRPAGGRSRGRDDLRGRLPLPRCGRPDARSATSRQRSACAARARISGIFRPDQRDARPGRGGHRIVSAARAAGARPRRPGIGRTTRAERRQPARRSADAPGDRPGAADAAGRGGRAMSGEQISHVPSSAWVTVERGRDVLAEHLHALELALHQRHERGDVLLGDLHARRLELGHDDRPDERLGVRRVECRPSAWPRRRADVPVWRPRRRR